MTFFNIPYVGSRVANACNTNISDGTKLINQIYIEGYNDGSNKLHKFILHERVILFEPQLLTLI